LTNDNWAVSIRTSSQDAAHHHQVDVLAGRQPDQDLPGERGSRATEVDDNHVIVLEDGFIAGALEVVAVVGIASPSELLDRSPKITHSLIMCV